MGASRTDICSSFLFLFISLTLFIFVPPPPSLRFFSFSPLTLAKSVSSRLTQQTFLPSLWESSISSKGEERNVGQTVSRLSLLLFCSCFAAHHPPPLPFPIVSPLLWGILYRFGQVIVQDPSDGVSFLMNLYSF